jgi:hypothetical protein
MSNPRSNAILTMRVSSLLANVDRSGDGLWLTSNNKGACVRLAARLTPPVESRASGTQQPRHRVGQK